MFSLKEIRHLLISIIVLTFAFAFDDKKAKFVFENWITNFIYFFLTVIIVVFIYQIAQKLMAYKYKANAEYRLISAHRFWFGPSKNKINYPIGIFLSLIITLFTKGKLLWLVVGGFIINYKKYKRLGFRMAHVTEYEIAKIAAAGPLAATLLSLIFKSVGGFNEMVLVSSLYSVFNMIPFGDSDGTKILFGAKYMYFFVLSFVLISAILVNLVSGVLSGIIALLMAAVVFFSILYKALQ